MSAFMDNLQSELRSAGAALLINTALRPLGREIPSLRILRDTGFVPLTTLYRPWAEKKGYCPYCKQDFCICDAVLYVREFDEKKDEARDG